MCSLYSTGQTLTPVGGIRIDLVLYVRTTRLGNPVSSAKIISGYVTWPDLEIFHIKMSGGEEVYLVKEEWAKNDHEGECWSGGRRRRMRRWWRRGCRRRRKRPWGGAQSRSTDQIWNRTPPTDFPSCSLALSAVDVAPALVTLLQSTCSVKLVYGRRVRRKAIARCLLLFFILRPVF